MQQHKFGSLALIDPLGDYGIGGYTHELAEGLVAAGADVHVYTTGSATIQNLGLPCHYHVHAVLGSSLLKRSLRVLLGQAVDNPASPQPQPTRQPFHTPAKDTVNCRQNATSLADTVVSLELPFYLWLRGHKIVWTQWPDLDRYGDAFWSRCRRLGMYVVHTVHNILPHEAEADSDGRYGRIYGSCDLLLVHSRQAREEFCQMYPHLKTKVEIYPHGLYSIYTRRPETREPLRRELGITPDQKLLLFFGGVRPYKNLDAVLEVMTAPELSGCRLLVAGSESGYPDLVPGDRLGRTRRRVSELGLSQKVLLRPGPFSLAETSQIFEAADIVLLPYEKSYGSGLLLLAMTFGKHVLITATGGMHEYVRQYPLHTMLAGHRPEHVLHGLTHALRQHASQTWVPDPELQWSSIGRSILELLKERHSEPGMGSTHVPRPELEILGR